MCIVSLLNEVHIRLAITVTMRAAVLTTSQLLLVRSCVYSMVVLVQRRSLSCADAACLWWQAEGYDKGLEQRVSNLEDIISQIKQGK